jgi:hypothetical protein
MTKTQARHDFIATMTPEGVPVRVLELVMRHATTLHRLAERECNGDDWQGGDAKLAYQVGTMVACPRAPKQSFNRNGLYIGPDTDYCPTCDTKAGHSLMTKSAVREAAIQARICTLLAPYRITPVFSGDPRGAVVKLRVPSGKTDDWGQIGVCVP